MRMLGLLALCAVAAAVQAVLPSVGGLRVELLPALVAVAVLSLRRGPALLLAGTAGGLQDALSAAPFGLTAFAYGVVAVVLTGLRDSLDGELPWVQMAVGGLLSAAASLAAWCVVGISTGAVFHLALLTVFSGLLTPVVFWAVRR